MQAHTARMLRTEVVKKEQNNKNIIVVQGNLRPLHPHCSRFFLHYLITTTQHTTAKLLGKFTIASPSTETIIHAAETNTQCSVLHNRSPSCMKHFSLEKPNSQYVKGRMRIINLII